MSAQHSGLRVQLASLNANAKLESDALPEFERWLIPTCGEDETSGFATAPTPPRLKPSAMCVGPREAPDLYAVGFQELGALSAALAGCTETLRASVDREIRRTLRVHQATVRPDRMYDPLEMGGGPENYALIAEVVHGGIVLFVYARERPPQVVAAHRKEVRSAAERIREVRTTQVGTGIFDVMGNKGAVGARVRVASSTPGAEDEVYTFVCAHLAAHDHNVQRRNADWRSIAERLVFSHKQLGYIPSVLPRNLGGDPSATIAQVQSVPTKTVAEHQSSALDEKEYSLYDTHRLFVMGDLNYRISANSVGVNPADGTSDPSKFPPLNKRDIKSMLASKDPERWTWLLPYDQLIAQRAHTPPLAFQELCVPDMNRWRIPPTYKYIIPASSKQGADILNPKRIPGWTDRILWSGGDAQCELYRSIMRSRKSDHKPITAILALDPAPATFLRAPWPINPQWRSLQRTGIVLDRIVGYLWSLLLLFGNGSLLFAFLELVLLVGLSVWYLQTASLPFQ